MFKITTVSVVVIERLLKPTSVSFTYTYVNS